jgi:hypothetical protein
MNQTIFCGQLEILNEILLDEFDFIIRCHGIPSFVDEITFIKVLG